MKITKIGHCCLLIEVGGRKILTDPGKWNDLSEDLESIDAVLLTHEHADHVHSDHLNKILEVNPEIRIITNTSVSSVIKEWGFTAEVIADNSEINIDGFLFKAFESQHAEIYGDAGRVVNSSFMINDILFLPGDSLFNPEIEVPVLALPVCGPWLKMTDVIDYAKSILPKVAFPVHDGMLNDMGPFHAVPMRVLTEEGIDFRPIIAGDSFEYVK